jgi:NAD(P)-dependent dehydrogenase (short-subunit alcohol dehydrogenase family)
MRAARCRTILLVDDFSGSGDQIIRFWRGFKAHPTLRSWLSYHRIACHVAVFAATQVARKKLERIAGRTRRREHRYCRKDGGAAREARRDDLHGSRADRQGGGRALPLTVDIRDEERVANAVRETADKFGGIDILVNNASAIRTTGTLDTPVRRYDLMHGVNGRGTFVCSQSCLPYLMKAENPHILPISPPLTHDAKWFAPHPPYSIAKYTMSLFTLALAAEFAETRDRRELALAPHGHRNCCCALRARRRGDDLGHAQARDRG